MDHPHHETQHLGYVRATIDEVAEENRSSAMGMSPEAGGVNTVSEHRQETLELLVTAMNVPDDVEWAVIRPPIVPERLPFHCDGADLLVRAQQVDVTKSLSLKISEGASAAGCAAGG